jgi:tryptophanyl-tRNA synthetase
MSKTVEGSYITLADDLETIKKRLAKAPTDSGKVGGEIPKTGGVANLFGLFRLFVNEDMYNSFVRDYKDAKIRYAEMKNVLAEEIYKEIRPIQERRETYEQNPALVDQIIEAHAEKCQDFTSQTMREVKEKMGLL